MSNTIELKNFTNEIQKEIIGQIQKEAKKSGLKVNLKKDKIELIGEESKIKSFMKNINK